MTDAKKIEIARDFVENHIESNPDTWQPVHIFNEEEKLLQVYGALENGLYGEVRETDGEYEVEIGGSCHKSGNPYLFTWTL